MLTHKDKYASGDIISEGYFQTTHKRSTLVVEGMPVTRKSTSSFLSFTLLAALPRQIYVIEITAPIPAA